MFNDLRFAFRQFAKSPGFTAAVVLSLALGIAANATVLCWLQTFVTRPLRGVPGQDEMVVVVSNQGSGCVSIKDLRDFADQRDVFVDGLVSMPTAACLTVDRHPQWIQAQVVTANFFDILKVKSMLGRTFLPEEDQKPGGNPVLVISERLWRHAFEAAPDIIGRVVDLNRHAFTIVGVVPAEFSGTLPPTEFDAWAPASMIWEVRNQGQNFLTSRTARGWHNLARLQPGVTLARARAAVATTDSRLAKMYPVDNGQVHHRLVSVQECPWGGQTVLGPALRLLLGVSLGVQLIVTANVANLLVARAIDRRREIAVRLSAGASRLRIIRQFLTESLVLALAGGLLGTFIAVWSVDWLVLLLPAELASGFMITFHLDTVTLALTFALAIITGLTFGAIPALHATKQDIATVLKEGGRGVAGGAGHPRLRRLLVVGEIAVALVLLVSAALCAQGFRNARKIDFGFNPDHVLLGRMQIGMNGYDRTTGPLFYRDLRQRLALTPGVEDAALASWFPLGLSGCKGWAVDAEGYQRQPDENPTYEFAIISPRYFATMQIPLLTGRDFTDADDNTAPRVAIVNEHFARKFWPSRDALGRRIRVGGQWRTIVGIAKAGKYNRLDEAPWPFFYLPYQQGVPDLDLDICVRTRGNPVAFGESLRQVIKKLDPGVEVLKTVSLSAHSSMSLFVQRVTSSLLTLLAAVALLLAAMGVYGVVSYTVSQRTQEFGVRLALGAKPSDLVFNVIRHGMLLGMTGMAVGAVLSLITTRVLRGFLYGVSPFEPLTFLVVATVLTVVSIVACYVPARRAMRVNPVEALRAE